MSKVLSATCNSSGVVKVGDLEVSGAIITSQGAAASAGVVLLDGDKAWYIPSSASDVEKTIEKAIATITELASVLNTIGTTLTAIGAGMTGPTTAPPPTLPTSVLSITGSITSLNAIKTELNTLKGALI